MKGIQKLRLILAIVLVLGFLPGRAQAAEVPEGKFVLVAEAGGRLVIPPEYISYASGQTIGEALQGSRHTFSGLEQGQVTAIDGVVGNFTRSDQNGGYTLDTPASAVTHYRFSETVGGSQPSEGMQQLMTAMADYLEKEEDVRDAAKKAYQQAYQAFVGVESENARTLAMQLNKAVKDYEDLLNGTKYILSFADGSKAYSTANYPGVTITAVNAYGKSWLDDGDGKLEVPHGDYTFCIAQDGLSVSGEVEVTGAKTVTATLPAGMWLKREEFRLSGTYGDEKNEEQKFTDGEFLLETWEDRKVTVPVHDSFVGAVYTHAQYDNTLLKEVPTLTALYTMQNDTADGAEKDIAFDSWQSGAYSVLARGSAGNTVIYRLSSVGETGYTYSQDYTVTFARIPTLTSLTVMGRDRDDTAVDQAATTAFDGTVTDYTYKVLDTLASVTVTAQPLEADYTVTVNGESLGGGVTVAITGDMDIPVTVTAGGYTNTYTLHIRPGAGKTLSFISDKDVTVEVVNSNGVVMPFTIHKETETQKRYKYTLVPGETYRYIATKSSYYHIADDFSLEEVANSLITVDFSDMGDWLTELAFGGKKNEKYKGAIPLTTAFSPENHSYETELSDTEFNVFAWVKTTQADADIQLLHRQVFASNLYHGKPYQEEISSGLKTGTQVKRFLMKENPTENTVTIRLSRDVDGVQWYQDYQVDFHRKLTVKALSAKSDGVPLTLSQADGTLGFDPLKTEYTVTVSMAAKELTLFPERYTASLCYGEKDAGYHLKVNGEDITKAGSATIPLDGTMDTQTVTVTVESPKAPRGVTTYTLHIRKSPPVNVTFQTAPEGALLTLHEANTGERIWPDEGGMAQLCEDYSYRYTLTKYGYVGRSGILEVTRDEEQRLVIKDGTQTHIVQEGASGGELTLAWTLPAAAVNGSIDPSISAYWPNFRGNNSNNAVTAARVPVTAEKGTLYWANQIGSGIDSDAVGSPILVDGDIITYASDKLYRVDPVTGEVLAEGTMDHKSSFSITPPTYAEGMVFVALSNGCVQAFNAATLESLWIYHDPLGGQPNCPLTVKNGRLYTGFWNSETGDANFVCLTITDEYPGTAKEEKCASWYATAKGGYYWAGAYVGDGFVLVGTDDGLNGYSSQTSRLLLLDAANGKLLDRWEGLNGDVRSTVVYDSTTNAYYFTSKGGSFYGVQVKNRKLVNGWSLQLENGVGGVPMSTCSPVVYQGRAYIGVSGAGQFSAYSGHNITVIDLASKRIAYRVDTQGYPQTSGLLTTGYEGENGCVYVYFFDNMTPGKLRVLRDRPGQTAGDYLTVEGSRSTAYALFTPTGEQAQYAICSPVVDEYGTIYFKNDSAHLMAFGSTIESLTITRQPDKTNYIAGDVFDPAGMVVTATYANGMTRDITQYVTYSKEPLTAQDTAFTITFPYVMYHNEEDGQQMRSGIPTPIPNVNVELTIDAGILGDTDGDGEVTVLDAQRILDYEARNWEGKPNLRVWDVSGDGVIDSNDAVLIAQFADGRLERFPAEEEKKAEEEQQEAP